MDSKLIYVVDDEAPMRVVVSKFLEKLGHRVEVFSSGSDAVVACDKILPDLLITDILMPEMNGVELIEAIRPLSGDIAIICMSGYATESTKQSLNELGITELLVKPISFESLTKSVEGALATPPVQLNFPRSSNKGSLGRPGRVLVVDDNEILLELEKDYISGCGYEVDGCLDGKAALEKMVICQYDIVLLDIVLPGISGLDVLKQIKVLDRNQPVIMITGEAYSETISQCEAITGDSCLRKPIDLNLIKERIESFDIQALRRGRQERREEVYHKVARKMDKWRRSSYKRSWNGAYSQGPVHSQGPYTPKKVAAMILVALVVGVALSSLLQPSHEAVVIRTKPDSGQIDIMKMGLEYLHRDEQRELDRDNSP